jgi:hypothetical protein
VLDLTNQEVLNITNQALEEKKKTTQPRQETRTPINTRTSAQPQQNPAGQGASGPRMDIEKRS